MSDDFGPLFRNGPRIVPKDDMRDLVAKSKRPCLHCGATSALNPHGLDKSKATTMMDMARLQRDGNEWVRVEEGRGLFGVTTETWLSTAYCASKHVYRCGYFGLTEQMKFRVANWRLTEKGFRFLRGDLSLPEKILVTDNAVRFESEECVRISMIRGLYRDKTYWDAYPWSDFFEENK